MNKSKKLKKVIIIIAAIIVFFLISNAIATKIIYDVIFARYDGEPSFDMAEYSDVISERESIKIVESDEKEEFLQAYFYDVTDEKGLVIIAPGLHAGADDYLPVTDYLYENGFDVLAFDPLGCNGSTGKSTIGFSQEILDLESVLEYASENYPEEELFLFGHSRGGFAVSAVLDSEYEISGVVSVSGLNSAMDAIMALSQKYVGKIANANYFNLWAYQAILFGSDLVDIEADDIISGSEVPVLIMQGSEDTIAPMEEFSIYSKNTDIEKGIIGEVYYYLSETEGSNGHTDILFDDDGVNDELMEEITAFLEKCAD